MDDQQILVTAPEELRQIFEQTRTIAVIGLSTDTARPSYRVASYLQSAGYIIVPIHPDKQPVLGETTYASLADVPADTIIDMVDVFRRPEFVPGHVAEVIARSQNQCQGEEQGNDKIGCLWLQDGVIHWEAARRAYEAGIAVVMDDCTLRQHRRLMLH